jgi:hypothetical protein
VLDALEAAAQHEQRHPERGERDAHVARDAGQLERRGDAGELGAHRADVRRHECEQSPGGDAHAVALPDEAGEPLAGDDPHPCAELVEEDQRGRREQQHPQQPIAVVGAEDRVGRDACRIVVRQAGEQARTEDREQGERCASASHDGGAARASGQPRGEPRALGRTELREGGRGRIDCQRGAGVHGQVHVAPGDGVAWRAAGEARKAEAAQHAVEPHLDALDRRSAPRDAQLEVADAHDATSREVDELRVEDVAREEDRRRHRPEVGAGGQDDRLRFHPLDVGPCHPRRRSPAAPDHDARHHGCRSGGSCADVGQLADLPP